ncbi:MAG: V-type ATP synthase subunit I [Bacteroidales bacterium]|nr:V-type ATP synthase subunit I [Bacteroidales bacterium]
MKKYTFLIYHKEYQEFLQSLQDLGMLHVIEKGTGELTDEALRDQYQLLSQLNAAIKFLSKREVSHQGIDSKNHHDGKAVLNQLQNTQHELEQNLQALAGINKEISQLEPWGDFSFDDINKLKEVDITVRFFVCPIKKFNPEWLSVYNIEEINRIGQSLYFVLFQENEETIEIDAEEIKLPVKSLSALKNQQKDYEKIIQKTEEVFDLFASKYIPLLEETKQQVTEKLDFDKVVLNTEKQAEDKLMILEGWAPREKEKEINSHLEKLDVYFESSSPDVNDNIPIKLKNNKFNKLFEPVGELYTMPDYKELDLTPFFAPFFMMFFGFCLGDVGYGLVILLAAIFLRFKVKGAMRSILGLGIFLGAATVIMGFISGTFFGVNLIETNIPWLESSKKFMLNTDQLMMLSFAVGFVQTIFGMGIKAANKAKQFGFVHALSTIGWIIVILGGATLFGLSKFNLITPEQFKLYMIIVGGFGAIFIFFLNSPGKNIFLNFGLGIWDTYGMASGLLGDLLSYVRLFALGISSAVLGNVFNQLAFSLSPDIIIVKQIVTLAILLFGHGLNLFMSALGSFVHPLRLTFVEFYKNAGFMGGGKKYDPFRKKFNIEQELTN